MSRRFDFVKDAAARLTAFLRPKDSVIVAPFSKQSGGRSPGPTGDRRTIVEAIEHIEPSGGTAILDSLIELSERLPQGEDRRSVILISDGYDEHSQPRSKRRSPRSRAPASRFMWSASAALRESRCKGERELKRLANETGGRVFFPPRAEELAGVYDQLAADAQNRYLVTYTPTNTARTAAWRSVKPDDMPSTSTSCGRAPAIGRPKPPPIRPTLEFTVTDLAGQYVDISADDLVVSEDGEDQKVDTFHEAVAPALDRARARCQRQHAKGERRTDGRGTNVRRSAAAGRQAVAPLLLRRRGDGARLWHEPADELDAIDGYKPVGGTALYDALAGARDAETVEGRRAVVVMTDGRDENNPGTAPGSRHTLLDVLELAREVEATVLPIGLGTNLDRERPGAPRGHFGRRRLFSVGRLGAARAVCEDDREPAAALRARLHVDAHAA